MRVRLKQFGLGLLNLLLVVLAIAAVQPLLKHLDLPARVAVPILALVALAAYVAGSKWIERRTPTELDPGKEIPRFFAGLALGIALFAAVMGVLWILGVYHPAGWGQFSGLAAGLAGAFAAGVMEELIFRGLLFRLSSKLVGTWIALAFTSLLFGAAHFGNEGATVWSSLAIAIEAGILLGATYTATRGLGVPIGLHIGWNFCEGSIFGMILSGNVMKPGAVAGSVNGPAILTGAQFGPEASMVAVILCTAVGVYFLWRTIKTGGVEPPMWAKAEERVRVADPS